MRKVYSDCQRPWRKRQRRPVNRYLAPWHSCQRRSGLLSILFGLADCNELRRRCHHDRNPSGVARWPFVSPVSFC